MKNKNVILYVLGLISYFLFYITTFGYIVSIILGVIYPTNEIDIKEGSKITFPNLIKGPYHIPINLKIRYLDSLTQEMKKAENHVNTKITHENYLKVRPQNIKDRIIGNERKIHQHLTANSTETHSFFGVPTTIEMKSTKWWVNLLFALRDHIQWLLWIFLYFKATRILELFEEKITFTKALSRHVKQIAWFLIGTQFILLTLSYVYSKFYKEVFLETVSSVGTSMQNVDIIYKARLEFSWDVIIVGGVVLLFAYLLEKGVDFKEEIDLTV